MEILGQVETLLIQERVLEAIELTTPLLKKSKKNGLCEGEELNHLLLDELNSIALNLLSLSALHRADSHNSKGDVDSALTWYKLVNEERSSKEIVYQSVHNCGVLLSSVEGKELEGVEKFKDALEK